MCQEPSTESVFSKHSSWSDQIATATGASPCLAGASSVPVTEHQHLKFAEDGGFTVKSMPVLGITGGSKFSTTTLVTASNLADRAGHCRATVKAACEAAGPWGMVGTIEGIMADQALVAIDRLLDHCVRLCADVATAAQLVGDPAEEACNDMQAGRGW